MKLTIDQIENIAVGAVKVVADGNFVKLYRFTEEQFKMYEKYRDGFFAGKTYCSSGIKLAFTTNSQTLKIKGNAIGKSARTYYAIDLVVNGELKESLTNFDQPIDSGYTWKTFPLGDFEKTFELPDGEKKVELYLPFSVAICFEEICLDDAAFVEPIKANKKGLLFGDSITQGYDCVYPSKHHTAILSKAFGIDFVNKAIGGEYFNPLLAKTKDDFEPDYILIAYGTNDWSNAVTLERFTNNCKEFCQNVRNNYPKAKIFIIAPIWRKDKDERDVKFDFMMLAQAIKQVANQVGNVIFVDGYDFVPHSEDFFGDQYLHPNDLGFEHYAKNLCDAIKEKI